MDPLSGIFFLKFILVSYAAVFFFSAGVALSVTHHLKILELVAFFSLMFLALHFSFKTASREVHFVITAIWASVLWAGFRFGKKIPRTR